MEAGNALGSWAVGGIDDREQHGKSPGVEVDDQEMYAGLISVKQVTKTETGKDR